MSRGHIISREQIHCISTCCDNSQWLESTCMDWSHRRCWPDLHFSRSRFGNGHLHAASCCCKPKWKVGLRDLWSWLSFWQTWVDVCYIACWNKANLKAWHRKIRAPAAASCCRRKDCRVNLDHLSSPILFCHIWSCCRPWQHKNPSLIHSLTPRPKFNFWLDHQSIFPDIILPGTYLVGASAGNLNQGDRLSYNATLWMFLCTWMEAQTERVWPECESQGPGYWLQPAEPNSTTDDASSAKWGLFECDHFGKGDFTSLIVTGRSRNTRTVPSVGTEDLPWVTVSRFAYCLSERQPWARYREAEVTAWGCVDVCLLHKSKGFCATTLFSRMSLPAPPQRVMRVEKLLRRTAA